jgi:hypothetical protein
MPEYEITCINKSQHPPQHEDITHIGNATDGWRITAEAAIQKIEAKSDRFYILDREADRRCYLDVVRENGVQPFLRVQNRGEWNDMLLEQPECDQSCRIVRTCRALSITL